jgi:hypothetical protein
MLYRPNGAVGHRHHRRRHGVYSKKPFAEVERAQLTTPAVARCFFITLDKA